MIFFMVLIKVHFQDFLCKRLSCKMYLCEDRTENSRGPSKFWDQIDISLEVIYQVSMKNVALVKPQIDGTIIIWDQFLFPLMSKLRASTTFEIGILNLKSRYFCNILNICCGVFLSKKDG